MEENKNMKSFISDAVDCKGGPADRTTTGGWVSAALILGGFYPTLFVLSTY